MEKTHDGGFFCASLAGTPSKYLMQAMLWSGPIIEFEDPYRFGPLITDFELHLHTEGTHYEAYRTLGAHLADADGVKGVRFAVWAPNAESVTLAGEFNQWDTRRHPMRRRNGGVWELFIPELGAGTSYKYNVRSRFAAYQQLKADPYAFEVRGPAQVRLRRVGYRKIRVAGRRPGWKSAAAPTCSKRPSPFTKCTSNPGCAARRGSS